MEIKALVADSSKKARKNIARSLNEIGVREVLVAAGQFLGHAIGPTSVAARAARIRVADSLGKRITNGHIAAPETPLARAGLGHVSLQSIGVAP